MGKYKLGIVLTVNASSDGLVQSVTVQYFIKQGNGEALTAQQVVCSVQRLVMVLPVEEQSENLQVQEDAQVQICKAPWKRGCKECRLWLWLMNPLLVNIAYLDFRTHHCVFEYWTYFIRYSCFYFISFSAGSIMYIIVCWIGRKFVMSQI